ncbi:MAG: hypothetical protein QXU32_02720 [Nitrososphaerales archaeon]
MDKKLNYRSAKKVGCLSSNVKHSFLFGSLFFSLLPVIPALGQGPLDERVISIPFNTFSIPTIDGAWTTEFEWVAAKGWYIHYDNSGEMILKTTHDTEYIYVLLELISDEVRNDKDMALICFDTKADGGDAPQEDDYCFIVYMSGTTLVERGNSVDYDEIPITDGIIMKGGMSADKSPYYVEPHTSFEFRIPVDIIGPSERYGFYALVLNADTGSISDEDQEEPHVVPTCGIQYDWPGEYGEQGLISDPNCLRAPPSKWGTLVSPTGTIPEFPMPVIVLTSILATTILIARRKNIMNYWR